MYYKGKLYRANCFIENSRCILRYWLFLKTKGPSYRLKVDPYKTTFVVHPQAKVQAKFPSPLSSMLFFQWFIIFPSLCLRLLLIFFANSSITLNWFMNPKWLITQKNCRVSPISTRPFCYVTCTFKRLSLWLFRFKISQFVPFCIFSIDFADF